MVWSLRFNAFPRGGAKARNVYFTVPVSIFCLQPVFVYLVRNKYRYNLYACTSDGLFSTDSFQVWTLKCFKSMQVFPCHFFNGKCFQRICTKEAFLLVHGTRYKHTYAYTQNCFRRTTQKSRLPRTGIVLLYTHIPGIYINSYVCEVFVFYRAHLFVQALFGKIHRLIRLKGVVAIWCPPHQPLYGFRVLFLHNFVALCPPYV